MKSQPEPSLLLLSRIGVRIHHLNKHFEKVSGMSLVQWCVMSRLVDLPGASAQELAEAAGVHPSTLTQSLKRLETKAFVYVGEHPRDSRRKAISATREGKLALDRLTRELGSEIARLSGIGRELARIDDALGSMGAVLVDDRVEDQKKAR